MDSRHPEGFHIGGRRFGYRRGTVIAVMQSLLLAVRRRWLEGLLAISLGGLCIQLHFALTPSDSSATVDLESLVDTLVTRDNAPEGLNPSCPQHIREQQELVDVVFYSFDGYLHRGQLLIDRELTKDIQYVFKIARDNRFPIASVIPIAHPGFRRDGRWDDLLSMQANNTSAFNYRQTTSGEMLSDHALGRAIDINPIQNPYINGDAIQPHGAIYDPSAPGTLTVESPVVRAFLDLGWQWGGHWRQQKDYQHFAKPASVRAVDYDVDAEVHRQQANRVDCD